MKYFLKLQLFQKETQKQKLRPLDSNITLRISLAFLMRRKTFIYIIKKKAGELIIADDRKFYSVLQNTFPVFSVMPKILKFAV